MKLKLVVRVIFGVVGILAAGCNSSKLAPDSGRCGPTPRLLVSAATWAPDGGGGQNVVGGMAVDGTDLYFSLALHYPTGSLMHVSTSGGAATELANGDQFQAPVVTPTSVLVGIVDESSLAGGILSFPRNGGSSMPLVVLPGDELVPPPVTDGTSVYFATASGTVDAVPLTPGASPPAPTQLTSDYAIGLGVFGQRLLVMVQNGRINEIPIGSTDAGGETMLGASPYRPCLGP